MPEDGHTSRPNVREWIVKFYRRKDGKKYYYRHDGCLTARKESSMMLTETVAKGLALAIRTHHRDFTARAMQYSRKPKEDTGT